MKAAFLILSLLFIFFLFPKYDTRSVQSIEEPYCGPIDSLVSLLDDYKEVMIFNGMSSDNQDADQMYLLTVNVTTGTWTEFSLNKDGLVCIIQEGKNAVVGPMVLKPNSTI